jgi:[acyl-carrier-protein] S-malonyltransferase
VTAAAWVDGSAIDVAEVDERLAQLRSRDRAGSLPEPDSREGRQLRRWVTQVAVVERLCEHSADSFVRAGAGIPCASEHEPGLGAVVSRADAAALGSIVAAAWTNNAAVPRAAALVTRDVTVGPERLRRAAELSATDDGGTAWSADTLVASARMEAFARWLARATHERVRLEEGFEHPGDANQPDNLHEH